MTHRVRCHTSTGCLIAALRTVSAWVKWAERLSTVRWAEATVLLLIWLGGWILRRCGRSGSSWVSTPAQFYSWGASAAIHAGGHRNAPNTSSFEWHLKPQNVAECGHWSKCFSFFFFPTSHFWSGILCCYRRCIFFQPSQQHDLTKKFYCNVSLWQVYRWKMGWKQMKSTQTQRVQRQRTVEKRQILIRFPRMRSSCAYANSRIWAGFFTFKCVTPIKSRHQ